jgi:RNA polymerase sigma-70 factor (ECF subfamily)
MDSRLVAQAQGGDEAAFAILTGQLVGRFQRVAFAILRDPDLAADATQAGLVRIWQKLPRLRDPDRFEAWAYRLLVHACYAEAKRARRSDVVVTPVTEPSVPDVMEVIVRRDQLERGFARLTLEQRAVIVLRIYFDLPVEHVAEALDVPVGTVKSRLHRAVSALRASLEADARPPTRTRSSPEVSR